VHIVFFAETADIVDVLYNRFDVRSSTPPANPPMDQSSDYKCVVASIAHYWRLSRCTDKQRVVCQSGQRSLVLSLNVTMHYVKYGFWRWPNPRVLYDLWSLYCCLHRDNTYYRSVSSINITKDICKNFECV